MGVPQNEQTEVAECTPVLSPLAKKPVTMGISWGPPLVRVKEVLMLAKDCSYRTSAFVKSSDDTMPKSQASYCRAATPCRNDSMVSVQTSDT